MIGSLEIQRDAPVMATEVENLREEVGWDRFPKYHLILPNSYAHFTVRKEERLVGFVNVISDGTADAFLVDLLIAPDFQKKGLGKALVQKAIADLTTDGICCIQTTFPPELQGFYQECGFHIFCGGIIDNHAPPSSACPEKK